ncbi:hypothetical protein CLAFUW4_08443 [Fulvia fulva]|uniref:MYND-type domain-containing protein n=1 Tax=Passalora fulva TaxID=5499 RepID=A0A9Q8LCG5_PASFU|nr:uncharacterized protein CLAFUR5_08547 [Fulvia fulva]UJO14830.1 hypothetical protein CLAFUR5_08547 [Fulvia fulva]WPV12410.1 hypothetical protein CLAFUW4_08443 [Fulvia fulva]
MAQTPALLTEQQCSYCKTKSDDKLSLCTGCRVVRYCSKEHQATHWPTHKSQCIPVKRARVLMEKEETKLRNFPGDWTTPANPFNEPGHFWGWLETRDFMRAKSGYIHTIREIRTREAITIAHAETMDVFRLNRSDNMGMRGSAPSLMMRLGKDQEAYDFIKWYATADPDGHYDWGDMALPFLNLRGENVFESVGVLKVSEYSLEFSHTVALTLIKLRLLLDLHSLKRSSTIADKLPQELLDRIREELVSDVVAVHQEILEEVRNGVDISPRIREVEGQVNTLFNTVKKANSHFWPAMAKPGRNLTAQPEYYSRGTVEEMQVYLQANYAAWEETPGAIAWVKERLSRRA